MSRKVLQKLNSFHKSLNFTFDPFPGEVNFSDIKIDKTKTDIYRKDTNTGQYVHFTSFEPWYRKPAWVKSLVERAERISNKHLFEKQILKIKSFMSWNGYPIYVCNSVLKRLKERKTQQSDFLFRKKKKKFPEVGLGSLILVVRSVKKKHIKASQIL